MQYQDLNKLEDDLRNTELKRSRKGKEHKIKKTQLISTQVEDKFNDIKTISSEYIKNITHVKYKYPVLSLYLNFDPVKTIRDPKVYLSFVNSYKAQLFDKSNKYIKQLSHNDQVSIEKDLQEITSLLENQLTIEEFKSLIVFKSNEELHTIIKLPIHIKDHFSIDPNPYTTQLEAILQSQPTILIIKLDKDAGIFYSYQMGNYNEIKRIETFTPNDRVDKSRPQKIQRQRLEHLYQHFSKIGEYAYKQIITNRFDFVIVVGHEKTTTKKFIDTLHDEVQSRLLNTAFISPLDFEDKKKMNNIIEDALKVYKEELENVALEELANAKGQGRLVEGLEQTVKAFNRGLLTTLYVNGEYVETGYLCPKRHYISLDRKVCRVCESQLIPVNNLVDELIELAGAQNVDTLIFTNKLKEIKKYNNVAALLYIQ